MNDSDIQAFDLKIGKTIRELVLEILRHERKASERAFLEMDNPSTKFPKPDPSRKSSAAASSKKVGKAAGTHGTRLTRQQKLDLVTAPGITQTPEQRVKAVKDLGEGSKAAQKAMESLQKQGLVDRSKEKESQQKRGLIHRPKANEIVSPKHKDIKTSKHEDTETSELESEPEPRAPKTRGIARRSTRLIDKPVKKSKVLLDIYDLGEPEDEAWDMPVYKNPPRYHRN